MASFVKNLQKIFQTSKNKSIKYLKSKNTKIQIKHKIDSVDNIKNLRITSGKDVSKETLYNNDKTIKLLSELEEILLDSIFIKSNVIFKDENYKQELKNEIKQSTIYNTLITTATLKHILISEQSTSINNYNNHLNTVLSIIKAPEWLVLSNDTLFMQKVSELLVEPLNALKNELIFDEKDLENYINSLNKAKKDKENLLNRAEYYMNTGDNFPTKDFYTKNSQSEFLLDMYRNRNISLNYLLKENKNDSLNSYVNSFTEYIIKEFSDTIKNFCDYDKLSTSLKFQNAFTFILADIEKTIEKFKPISEIESVPMKQEIITSSNLFTYLQKILNYMKEEIHLFTFADYSNSNNLIKFQQFRNFLYWSNLLLNRLKEKGFSETQTELVFNENFVEIVDTAFKIIKDDSWSKTEWSINDSFNKWILYLKKNKLPYIKRNFNEGEYLISQDTPLDILYKSLTDISFYHLLDVTLENQIITYLMDVQNALDDGKLKETQDLIMWFKNNLYQFTGVNKGHGFLVSEYLKSINQYGSKGLLKDLDIITKENFEQIFKVCQRLSRNEFNSLDELKKDVETLLEIYKVTYEFIQHQNKKELDFHQAISSGDILGEGGITIENI